MRIHSIGNDMSAGPKMRGTPDDKCVRECVRHDKSDKCALYDGRDVYVLSDRKRPEQFAGRKVKVTGALYQKTKIVKVDSISAAKRRFRLLRKVRGDFSKPTDAAAVLTGELGRLVPLCECEHAWRTTIILQFSMLLIGFQYRLFCRAHVHVATLDKISLAGR